MKKSASSGSTAKGFRGLNKSSSANSQKGLNKSHLSNEVTTAMSNSTTSGNTMTPMDQAVRPSVASNVPTAVASPEPSRPGSTDPGRHTQHQQRPGAVTEDMMVNYLSGSERGSSPEFQHNQDPLATTPHMVRLSDNLDKWTGLMKKAIMVILF
jgi:hypothetical protein